MKKNYNIFIIITFLVLSSPILSQELVINGDFRKLKTKSHRSIENLYGWNKVSGFIKCFRIKDNKIMADNSFNKYLTFTEYITYNPYLNKDTVSGIETKLKNTLQKGKQYKFECKYKIVNQSNIELPHNLIAVKLYDNPTTIENINSSDNETIYPLEQKGIRKGGMRLFSTTFISDGSEKYMYLGNDSKIGKFKVVLGKVSLTKIIANQHETDTTIRRIFFSFENNSSEIDSETKELIHKHLPSLKKSVKLTIYGHTDNVGNTRANLNLADDRAYNVAKYIISQGVDKSKITCISNGEESPLVNNSNNGNKRRNRRVEIVVKF